MSARDEALALIARWAAEEPLGAGLAAAVLGGVLTLFLVLAIRAALRPRADQSGMSPGTDPRLEALERAIMGVTAAQERSAGALSQVAEAAARAQADTAQLVEARLDAVGARLGDGLETSAASTARSLGALSERLDSIDRAQANLEKLSTDMLGLQDILSDKQTRGVYGELQLEELVRASLPPSAFAFQETLSNGRRADALLKLPNPPGPIAVDAKFPLEAFEALHRADRGPERDAAAKAFAKSVRVHIRAIAERYVIPGETADGALMFLPSEAIYAELHASHPEVVREGFAVRVWIVSPTTLMATLTTMRAVLKDARLREEAADLRHALGALGADLDRVAERARQLRTHFGQAERDIAGVETAAKTAQRRLRRIESDDERAELDAPAGAVLPGSDGVDAA